uniref:Uncharacterized protein n=1 Tax=Canis lupus familiaris TaxID=9615 RepID=A0A8I3PK67_CANLF
VRIGDHHGVFHAFCCGNGHLLVRLPTKESVKRQRVGQVERPAMRRNGLKVKGRVHALVMQVIPSTKASWNVYLCSDEMTTYYGRQAALHQLLDGMVFSGGSLRIPIS